MAKRSLLRMSVRYEFGSAFAAFLCMSYASKLELSLSNPKPPEIVPQTPEKEIYPQQSPEIIPKRVETEISPKRQDPEIYPEKSPQIYPDPSENPIELPEQVEMSVNE